MNDIDTRLRVHADRWRLAHAAVPTPTIPELVTGNVIRPRAWLAVAASVVAVALVAAGLAAYAARQPNRAEPGGATVHVPWSPIGQVPDTSYHNAAPPAKAPASMRTCTAADLRVLLVRTAPDPTPATTGWLSTSLVLRSSAGSRCAATHGPLPATLLSADGTQLPVDGSGFVPAGAYVPPPTRQIVAPGDEVFVTATWAADTNRVPRPDRLSIWFGLPQSRTDPMTVPLGHVAIPPPPAMPGNPSWRSASSATLDRVAPAGSMASLTAALGVPTSVPAGSVLRYSVTLSNTTDVAVPLHPCPTIAQHVDVKGLRPVRSAGTIGPLNCTDAPRAIAPGGSGVFDYQIALPAGLSGFALLDWSVLDGASVLLSARGFAAVN